MPKLKPLNFTYQGDGKGNTRFFYGTKPMWNGQVFKIDRSVAKSFVDEMNILSVKDVLAVGGGVVDFFYERFLEPAIPRSRWQRFKRWWKRKMKGTVLG